MLECKCSDEQTVLPSLIFIAFHLHQSARSDRRHPVGNSLLQSILGSFVCNMSAVIVDSISDQWPPIIFSFLYFVEFIIAFRAVFYVPQCFCPRIIDQSLWIAVSITPDLRFGSFGVYKR